MTDHSASCTVQPCVPKRAYDVIAHITILRCYCRRPAQMKKEGKNICKTTTTPPVLAVTSRNMNINAATVDLLTYGGSIVRALMNRRHSTLSSMSRHISSVLVKLTSFLMVSMNVSFGLPTPLEPLSGIQKRSWLASSSGWRCTWPASLSLRVRTVSEARRRC